MKRLFLAASGLLLIYNFSCGFSIENGDLLFQTEGKSLFSKAISSSTGEVDSLNFVHVGIACADGESVTVIEASPEAGVRCVPLDTFLNHSSKIGGNPGVVVKRLNREFDSDAVIERALSHSGEPYDWYYLPDNGMMYCSELVYEVYLDENGERIFHSKPMNFRDANGNLPQFWINLYKQLGVDVPEGIPGTNPNDLSKETSLYEVYRYF